MDKEMSGSPDISNDVRQEAGGARPRPPQESSLEQLSARYLPRPLTPLIGRGDEIAGARALLDRGDVRLLTLTGPGGVGKTRFALALAAELEGTFAHGVRFVRLATIRDPEHVGPAVALALGIHEAGGRSASSALVDLLHDQHLLLVLDNLEQIVEAGPWLAELLAACPRLTVLATSRAPLRLSGEQRFPVSPLPVPPEGVASTLSQLTDYGAIALFIQRAHAVRPEFALTEANAEAVAEICRRLDGLPLAIELAAARISVFTPEALAKRLARSLSLLTGGPRDQPVRLRSMRDAIAWSYDLLSPEEQALLRWLSVFLGGCSLDAANAIGVALGQTREDATERVAALVEQSLLRSLPGERYGLLETIREFGLEQLALAGEETRARDAHAAWVRELVAAAAVGLHGRGQVSWLDRLESERANVRAALAWLADRGAVGPALETAASLWFFWLLRGDYAEERRQLENLLARQDAGQRTAGWARALNATAILASAQGESGRALAMNEEALAIFRARGDQSGIAWTLTTASIPLWRQAQFAEAIQRLEEGLAIYHALDDRGNALRAQGLLGTACLLNGEVTRAEALLREARAAALALGDRWIAARAANDLAVTLDMAIDWSVPGQIAPPEAEALRAESVRLTRELNDLFDLPEVLVDLGELRWWQGNLAEAAEIFEEVLAVAQKTGDRPVVAWALGHLGMYAQRQGDLERAGQCLRQALALTLDLDSQPGVAFQLKALGELALGLRQPVRAARLLAAAGRIMTERNEVEPAGYFAEYERNVQRVRQALGEARFLPAWEAGRAMSLADLTADANQLLTLVPVAPRPTHGLSTRELEVLQKMAEGRSNQEIADELFISVRTVTSHVSEILGKLDVPSRTSAVAFAIRAGLA